MKQERYCTQKYSSLFHSHIYLSVSYIKWGTGIPSLRCLYIYIRDLQIFTFHVSLFTFFFSLFTSRESRVVKKFSLLIFTSLVLCHGSRVTFHGCDLYFHVCESRHGWSVTFHVTGITPVTKIFTYKITSRVANHFSRLFTGPWREKTWKIYKSRVGIFTLFGLLVMYYCMKMV